MSNSIEEIDIISELKNFSDQNIVDVYLPTLSQTVQIRKLNVKQQKSLLLVALEDAMSILNFNIALYEIIEENIVDKKNVDITKLTILDRNSIVYHLLLDDVTETSDLNKTQLTKLINNYKKAKNIDPITITIKQITLNLISPTLYTDYRFNKTLYTKYTAGVSNKKQFIDDTYLIEISKYIQSIDIVKSSKNKVTTNLLEQKIDNILKIVDSLPALTKILTYMSDAKDNEAQLNTVDGKVVEINPTLFI